jgi:site-specific DNA-methyltransferase (adenine-specific)
MTFAVINGDNQELLKTFPDNHFDSIVTDPPYGIAFLGKDWDSRKATETTSKIAQLQNLPSGMAHTSLADDLEFQYWMRDVFAECLRVLKPGGHLLAFSAARTYHHMAMSAQTAGFEIRDQIMWIYSSGFPKSQDIGKSIDRAAGKKNQLKDRGTKGTKGDKIVKNSPGSGTLCPGCGRDSNARYSCDKGQACGMVYKPETEEAKTWLGWGTQLKPAHEPIVIARKPIKLSIAKNCQDWGVGALNIDATRIALEEHAINPDTQITYTDYSFGNAGEGNKQSKLPPKFNPNEAGRFPSNVLGDIPDYQKYFYCPKVSRAERHVGFDDPGPMFQGDRFDVYMPTAGKTDPNKQISAVEKKVEGKGNNHPTVKPIELMKYLIRLVTPPGGHVLDPFNGSGSTGCAAVELDMDYTGLELDPAYVAIAQRRIQAWYDHTHNNTFRELFE